MGFEFWAKIFSVELASGVSTTCGSGWFNIASQNGRKNIRTRIGQIKRSGADKDPNHFSDPSKFARSVSSVFEMANFNHPLPQVVPTE